MLLQGRLVGSTARLRITPFLKRQHDGAHALNKCQSDGHELASMGAVVLTGLPSVPQPFSMHLRERRIQPMLLFSWSLLVSSV